ncbi:uncharacterized protein LOC128738159 [Sabethes cyaneus]|uniref:uncharacterized protein LOC128738159 n=1 Tax=Sabethes cyaneus TaxID=53552 RepID=UPI00237D43EB|nr:uncharacterized protein LOC128738159 [Sabethes cyaneus]XP_053689046.1 uncharacterized protein LOC128738159 [Sabethes cyaneus]XP_053689047.1 uncharacterized protein LOC128738159 [Sabethes cyaneus]
MVSKIFNTFHKARFSGIRIVPANAPSLYQECVKVFVAEVNRNNQNGKRISELQFLPTAALVNIFEEMCKYPALRDVLREALSDPVLFMRIFTGHNTNQLIVDQCLREAGLSGEPVLPVLAKNYCDMVQKEPLGKDTPDFMRRLLGALKLGKYLLEAGWARSSVNVLTIAEGMISLIVDNRFHRELELDCTQLLLRSKGGCMTAQANETCNKLLSLVENITDDDLLVKAYLEVANHHYRAEQFETCHEWALKTMDMITDSTAAEHIIEVLQLEALYCFSKQRYDLGSMLISQAIQRARTHFGNQHRLYADVLHTYGQCLMKMNAVSEAVSTFMELLDVTIKLYGRLTPHVPIIQGYLAYGFYLRSQTTGRFDMALDQIDQATKLAKRLMPSNKQVIAHFAKIRVLIVKGFDSVAAATKERKPMKVESYQRFHFSEIREKYFELNGSF